MSDDSDRARMVGINHVALSVGDADEARAFYESIFEFEVRGETDHAAFLDVGDQFIALTEVVDAGEATDAHRHFGLVVDDTDVVERRLAETDADVLDTDGIDFLDPWGNRIQVVDYADVQFSKADHVLEGMGLGDLEKSDAALDELAEKGMAPE
ncbi:VOC family protein [Halosimplex amylolyticum]|uniref:VOC family protein n=1 Tax=Halosimplex amylolyticum TaxID=3396616 RepID=UPI003F55A45E